MKALHFTLISLLCFAVNLSFSQTTAPENETTFEKPIRFFKTPPLREMMKTLKPVDGETAYKNDHPNKHKRVRYNDYSMISDIGIPSNNHIDPAIQSENGPYKSTGRTRANWQAQFGAFPPDPTGAAGHNYFVQAVNSTYRVYDKEGTPKTPSYPLNTLFDGFGAGDPIVMYDRFAERWFISQFFGEPGGSDNGIMIAVSQTSDPLGAYYAYQYSFSLFPDYPKFSVWSNAYFMSANASSADCCAFQRDKMLLGDPSAGVIKMTFPYIPRYFNSIAPAYAEGPTEPDINAPCYFFAVQDDSYAGVSFDHIKVFKAEINWDAPITSKVKIHQSLKTAAFNTIFTDSWNDIRQKGTTQRLDAVTGIFMYRAQYRRFEGYNTMVLCHTVDVDNTNRAGVRWYELRDANDGNWVIHQQGTYSPDTKNSRWMGNAAMDAQGNIALAYSIAGTDEYAGLRYTGRFKDDPLGQMTVEEQIGVVGEGSQTTGNRYGDYSQMSMDPSDDMTFWFTGEYIGIGGSRKTQIFSFSSWHLSSIAESLAKVPYFNAYQPNSHQLTVTWNDINDTNLTLSLYDMQGRLIKEVREEAYAQEKIFTLPHNSKGIYLLRLTGNKTDLSKKIYLSH